MKEKGRNKPRRKKQRKQTNRGTVEKDRKETKKE